MSSNGDGKPARGSERVPINAEVDLEFESFQGFLSEYSSNISLGGMFVRTSEAPPVGTVLRFSLKLKGNFNLIQGRGEVVWTRPESEDPKVPAGAGIRFLELETASEDLIRRMVDRHRVQGGLPFELDADADADSTQEAPKASILANQPGDALQEDVFIPPDIAATAPAPLTEEPPGPSESPWPEAGGAAFAPRPPRKVRAGTVFLLLAAAITGGLVSHYGERLVHWITGYDKALAERVVYDVPPPVSLESSAEEARAAAQIPDEGEGEEQAVTPAEAGVTDLGPEHLSEPGGEPWIAFADDYASAQSGLSRIRLITWKESSDNLGTIVTLWGNGNLQRENIARVRLGGQPARELIKIKGIDWPFRDPVMDVESSEVRRIRTGFHPKESLNELHVVVDLKDPQSKLHRAELGGRSIELFFHR